MAKTATKKKTVTFEEATERLVDAQQKLATAKDARASIVEEHDAMIEFLKEECEVSDEDIANGDWLEMATAHQKRLKKRMTDIETKITTVVTDAEALLAEVSTDE